MTKTAVTKQTELEQEKKKETALAKPDETAVSEKGTWLEGLKERLEQHAKVGELIPESLKYYSVVYVDGEYTRNVSCFSREDAEMKLERLRKAGRQAKIVEGLRAAGVNLMARNLKIADCLDKSKIEHNLPAVAEALAAGKSAVLYCYVERTVEFQGDFFRGTSSSAQLINKIDGLDRIVHGLIGKCETRARARAQASAMGLPLQLAEEMEDVEPTKITTEVDITAETKETKATKAETPKAKPSQAPAPQPKVEDAIVVQEQRQTSRNERIALLIGKLESAIKDPAEQVEVVKKVKTTLGIEKDLGEVPEEVFWQIMAEVEKIITSPSPKPKTATTPPSVRIAKVKEIMASTGKSDNEQLEFIAKIKADLGINEKVADMPEEVWQKYIAAIQAAIETPPTPSFGDI